jgi:hypothetical protein
MKLIGIFVAGLLVSACASHNTKIKSVYTNDASEKIEAAVTIPLADLNLIETRIPPVLGAALKIPYAAPIDTSCENLAKEITALDEALGADLDTPVTKKNEGLIARSFVAGSVSAIRKNTEGVVPYRNWVRKLSGAERKSKTVASAISAGGIRRAYLKGIGQSNKCAAPAAPRLLTVTP